MKSNKVKSVLIKIGIYTCLIFWTIVVYFPIYWLITTSLKLPIDVFRGPKYFPFIDFQPYLHAWNYFLNIHRSELFIPFQNSVLISLISSALAVIIGGMGAYGLSRFKYRFGPWQNQQIAFWIISQRMLPPVAIVIPFLIMFRIAGLVDTLIGMIIAYTAFNLPFSIWILRDFFEGLPKELEESALIDGCSIFGAFVRIVIPISMPGIVAAFLFCLVFAFNEYLFALILTFQKATTMPVLIAGQNTTLGVQWWNISVLSIFAIAPMILIGLFLQRFITRGLLIGAIK